MTAPDSVAVSDPQNNAEMITVEGFSWEETDVTIASSNYPDYFSFAVEADAQDSMDLDTSQTYFWSDEWQDAEAEASEDIARSRVQAFNSIDDLIADLQS